VSIVSQSEESTKGADADEGGKLELLLGFNENVSDYDED